MLPHAGFFRVGTVRSTLLLFPLWHFCPYGVIAARGTPSTEENVDTDVVYVGKVCFLGPFLVGRSDGHDQQAGVVRSDEGKSYTEKSSDGLRAESGDA